MGLISSPPAALLKVAPSGASSANWAAGSAPMSLRPWESTTPQGAPRGGQGRRGGDTWAPKFQGGGKKKKKAPAVGNGRELPSGHGSLTIRLEQPGLDQQDVRSNLALDRQEPVVRDDKDIRRGFNPGFPHRSQQFLAPSVNPLERRASFGALPTVLVFGLIVL